MKEEASYAKPEENLSSGYISSEEQEEENNFHSLQVKPENIFENPKKENIEQISSAILCFPFKLDSYELINLKDKDEGELRDNDLVTISGSLEKIKTTDLILKLEFLSKDNNSSLNLKDFQEEMNSLTNLGLEFIAVCRNKLFIKCQDENDTNEAYSHLQKSSTIFDLLYEEEKDVNFNPLENQVKISPLFKDEEESNISSKEKNKESKESKKNDNGFSPNNIFEKDQTNYNINLNKIYKMEDINYNFDTKNIWLNKKINLFQNNNLNMNVKKTAFPNNNINNEQRAEPTIRNSYIYPPQIYPQMLFPMNNLQRMSQINSALLMANSKPNPFLIFNDMAYQNYLKYLQLSQSQSQISNNNAYNNDININMDKKYIFNKTKIFNSNLNNFKINQNMNKNNNLSPINRNEPSTNSNSSSSSKDSSPIFNNQTVNNNNTMYNNKVDDSKYLEEIVQNKKYKEYIPKNRKEKDVQFHTNSTRDYQFKYVSRYIVQIENEKNFPVTKMIIGNNGMLLRTIIYENCIKYGDNTTKIRLRGKGSGYKEGPNNEESKEPMELCISSLNIFTFSRCSNAIESILLRIYYQYYLYQCKNYLENNNKNNNNNNNLPISMKKILKYHYVVNRYNTLAKEEKKKKNLYL